MTTLPHGQISLSTATCLRILHINVKTILVTVMEQLTKLSTGTRFPVWGIFFAILPAVGFTVLGSLVGGTVFGPRGMERPGLVGSREWKWGSD